MAASTAPIPPRRCRPRFERRDILSRVARNPVHAEARGGRPLEYDVAGVSVLKGAGARSVGPTVRSIASGRSGARVSSWLRDFGGTGRSAETALRERTGAT